MKAVKVILSILLTLPFLFISIGFISFGFIIGWLTLALLIFALYKDYSNPRGILFYSIIWFIVNLVALPLTINQYNKTTDHYFSRVQKGEKLSFRENCNIYGMNLVLSAGGFLFFPEVAKETLLMVVPNNKPYVSNNNFFMESKLIQKALKKNNHKPGKIFVTWDAKAYLDFGGEARIALALNPCNLYVHKDNTISVEATMTYPPKFKAVLVQVPIKVQVQEGLFHYLEDIGWLHRYKIIYKTTCSAT